jgi:hypothetical protein
VVPIEPLADLQRNVGDQAKSRRLMPDFGARLLSRAHAIEKIVDKQNRHRQVAALFLDFGLWFDARLIALERAPPSGTT